ncbi:AAA family ATPase [Acetobacter ascendens]|uniref:AAA domain-containing protein n=1 Tax=Acetobacter ascendens TaxID=481146 RepID=A0A1Y0V238_9PROT|nr:DUF3696 domain-containing protein [Acetobacter ascendens]ARW12131.1 hypothetical protein S101447_03094 [Acetobacter ascendens]
MITKWKVKNFKSLKDPKERFFSPITILAGANSSGKSSIIQSILLLKQTLQYGPEGKPLALNGPILKLGSADSIHNDNSRDDPILFEISIEVDRKESSFFKWDEWNKATSTAESSDIHEVNISLLFSSTFNEKNNLKKSLTPIMLETRIKVLRKNKEGEVKEFTTTYKKNNEENNQMMSVLLDNRDIADIKKSRSLEKIRFGWASHFLPSWCFALFNQTMDKAKNICIYLSEGGVPSNSIRESYIDESINLLLLSKIVKIFSKYNYNVSFSEVETFRKLRAYLYNNFRPNESTSSETRFLRRRIDPEIMEPINLSIIEYYSNLKNQDLVPEPIEIPSLRGVNSIVSSFFKYGVHYLGPLREAPRPVYQPEAMEITTSVGYKGEHTAAVFELNKGRPVQYFRPPELNGKNSISKEFSVTTLEQAVGSWLNYLEIASDVVSEDAGVYGNTLKVSPEGSDNLYDLTNVGVGVSQVLPIIVESLLADYGSLLIFEQPELHLHPSVQSKLADFFISLQKSGKNILIETHSEYMIDRFRLRIVQDHGIEIKKSVTILFAEKKEGNTLLEEVNINEYGVITNWPKGFFDKTQSDVNEILKTAREKRMKSQKNA